MTHYKSEDIRNMALLGHAGSGKTTLTEALLARAGEISQCGSVIKGTTVTDFEPSEIELQHSIECGLCNFDHANKHVNIIDAPGYPDFYNRSISVLPAVETAAVVINAKMGIELIAQRCMEAAKKRNLCRMVIINKIDVEQTHLEEILEAVQDAFGSECLPLNLPADNASKVVDCYFKPEPVETDFASVNQAHDALVDQVVEVDEALMEVYLEQDSSLNPEQLHDPFEKALREGHLIPVCFVSAKTGAGLDLLLRTIEDLMPNPFEGNPAEFLKGSEDLPVTLSQQAHDHVLAHVFKVIINPFFGRLGIFRIHQGTISQHSALFIGDSKKPFKVNHLLKLQGKEHFEITSGIPGDICAVSRVDEMEYDCVLHDHHDEDLYHLQRMDLLPPMQGIAIKASKHGSEQKLSETLHKLVSEDPGLLVEHRANTDETILRGSSDLHLRTVLDKMRNMYNLEVETATPSVAYKETITQRAEGHHRHKKQSGGAGQFGEVFLKVEPLEQGQGIEFVNKVVGGSIPSQFIPGVEKGVHQAIESGVFAGFPIQDVRVTVYDGKHHSVDSKEIAFVQAGKRAFMEAIQKAKPKVLEPMVNMAIKVPAEKTGDITADIATMRGFVTGTDSLGNNRIEVSCEVPLSEVDGYQTRLSSETAGEGTFTMEFARYQQAPEKVQKQLHNAFSTQH